MDKRKFIDMVQIEKDVDTGIAGHYPFLGLLEDSKDEISLVALALNGIEEVSQSIMSLAFQQDNVQKVYFTADFPANSIISTDFVACFFWEKDEDISVILIPYAPDGERFPEIRSGVMVDKLVAQTKYLFGEIYKRHFRA